MLYSPTILYVEDEVNINHNMQQLLQYFSSKVYVAYDGEEGLDLYKKHTPDIVISDIKMPKMNGIEMCTLIKKINPLQYIIFTTAHNESDYFLDAIDLHVSGYVLKPIDFNILEKKLLEITEQINNKIRLKEQEVLTYEISKFQDNLLLVLNKDQEIIFSNDRFLDFFDVENLKSFTDKYTNIHSLFLKDSEIEKIVYLLDTNSNKKAFLTSIKHIDESSHTILILTEITSIEKQAFKDNLTNIYNRAYLEKEFDKEYKKFKKTNIPFSFLLFDIDFFKKINDTYGHEIGDEILIQFTSIITNNIPETSTFARWGGEEFVLLFPNASLQDSYQLAENLRKTIEKYIFTNNIQLTCSIGVSLLRKEDTQKTLMKRADDALYKAKNSGRNKVEKEMQ